MWLAGAFASTLIIIVGLTIVETTVLYIQYYCTTSHKLIETHLVNKGKTKTMSDEQTDSSLEIKNGLAVEEEIDIDDNISCQTDAITVIASNKRISAVSHIRNSSFEQIDIATRIDDVF